MGLILLMLGLSIVLTVAQGVVLAYLWRESQDAEPPALAAAQVAASPQFFATAATAGAADHRDARVDMLLDQLEQHIRLEHAVAESFLLAPTPATLHRLTDSPLRVH